MNLSVFPVITWQTNPFADEEAAEDDDGLENSDDDGDNVLDDDDEDEMNLRLDVSDEESGMALSV